jgi:hypothetical protein
MFFLIFQSFYLFTNAATVPTTFDAMAGRRWLMSYVLVVALGVLGYGGGRMGHNQLVAVSLQILDHVHECWPLFRVNVGTCL